MHAIDLISYSIPPLLWSDTGEKALAWMSDFHVSHLPVVDNSKFAGILSEDEILNFELHDLTIKEANPELRIEYVLKQNHLYDVLKLMVDRNLTSVPVLDEDFVYLGLITQDKMLKFFSDSIALSHPGAVLVIAIHPRDYSLSEISRLIELENAKIISCFISSVQGTEEMELTIKLSRQDIQHIKATLNRFGYQIKSSAFEEQQNDDLMDRYNMFMKYLNI
jgi:acetoin utilization protein AcuB